MEEEPPNFGAELKDAFKPVNAWVKNGISWMTDVEEFFRERSQIEREYAGKLNTLAKKYFEKKAKKATSLSVGDTPTLTPGSLESASMTTWTTLLTSTELVAQEHDRLGMDINVRVAEATKVLGIRLDEFRKKHEALDLKITKERDAQYSDLKKAKASYDSTCKDLEERRVKVEKSYDSSRSKAERSYQTQMGEMHNIKNTYIIAINVTNAQKEKYYHSDVPDILSSLQDLNEMRVEHMNALWVLSCSLSSATHTKCIEHYNTLSSEVSRNNPQLDSLMFIRHNTPPNGEWHEPQDFLFEASPIWHDTGEVMVDENAKVWLQNKISKSKGGLEGFRRDVEKRRRDVELLKDKRQALRKSSEPAGGKRTVDEMDIMKTLLSTQEELMSVDGKRVTLEVEVETVRQACGDIDQGAQSHKFKSTSFKIPTVCDVCHDKIWGLSAKGMSCKDCGFNCHSKCEMKVPANCPGPLDKAGKKAIKESRHIKQDSNVGNGAVDRLVELPSSNGSSTTLGRSNTTASTAPSDPQMGRSNSLFSKASISSKPAARRVLAPPPQKYVSELPAESDHSNEPRGKMIYTFTGQADGELSVSEGKEIVIVDEDDGTGWTKVRNGMQEGLVPTTYIEVLPQSNPTAHAPSSPTPTTPFSDRPPSSYSSSSASLAASLTGTTTKKKGPVVAPRRGAKKVNYAEALYDYQARTEDEFDMVVGDRFVLINPNTGDGWAEVEKNGVTKSVPSNYITQV